MNYIIEKIKLLERIKLLETNKIYTNYLAKYNDINHIINRCSFDTYLIKFINRCCKYNIKIYYINTLTDSLFYILNKSDVINQIILLKQNCIEKHIEHLHNLIIPLKQDPYSDFTLNNYLSLNSYVISHNKKLIRNLDKLIDLINIVYHFKLLEFTDSKIDNILQDKTNIIKNEYNNLVNLGNITNKKSLYTNNGVVIIDQYSS